MLYQTSEINLPHWRCRLQRDRQGDRSAIDSPIVPCWLEAVSENRQGRGRRVRRLAEVEDPVLPLKEVIEDLELRGGVSSQQRCARSPSRR